MVDQIEEPIYKVTLWTKDSHKWWYSNRTYTQAMEIYNTLKVGQIYEDKDEEGTVIEYTDGSWVFQVKVTKDA